METPFLKNWNTEVEEENVNPLEFETLTPFDDAVIGYNEESNVEIPEMEDYADFSFDFETPDWEKAIRLNEKYSQSLGWINFFSEINNILLKATGQSGISLGPRAFAEAVAEWQRQNGFAGNQADGIIGPSTWEKIQVILPGKLPAIPLVPSPFVQGSSAIPFDKPFMAVLAVQIAQRKILSPEKNRECTQKNNSQVQKSGLTVSEILDALNKYTDTNLVRSILQSKNNQSSGKIYAIGTSGSAGVDAVFTESIHQFQQTNYLNPKEHDGILGQSTLDSLGFKDHKLRPNLSNNNFFGQRRLNSPELRTQVYSQTNNEFSAANWYQYIVRPSLFGVKIHQGIHLMFLRKLREAERWLLNQVQYKGMTSVELGKALGFGPSSSYSGARLGPESSGMHGFGLALDIDYSGNPWIGAGWITAGKGLDERKRMLETLRKASSGVSLKGNTIFEFLHNIAQNHGSDTKRAYQELKRHNDQFVAYLKNNAGERRYWEQSQSFGKRNPSNGFLNMHPDLVYALRHVAKLAWGAIDFGPNASGDIMHFDMRTIGVGTILCRNSRGNGNGGYIPKSGHPIFSTEQKEVFSSFEDESMADAFEFHDEIEMFTEENELANELPFEVENDVLSEENEFSYEEDSDNLFSTKEDESEGWDSEEIDSPEFEFQQETDKDWSRAVSLNRKYASQLGWGKDAERINDLMLPYSGMQNVSLREDAFAAAVAKWQEQNGLSSDGILGPKSWQILQRTLGNGTSSTVNLTQSQPSVSVNFQPGKLKINTQVSALSKSIPEYQFTPEDAVWLARFVEGEAGGKDNKENHAVIWAMFNRFGMLRHRVPSWTSFAVFLQKYSTTLQPMLNSSGAAQRVWDNHRRDPNKYPIERGVGFYSGTNIQKVQYTKHIKLQRKPWGDFKPELQSMVEKLLTGHTPNPGIGIATHFLSSYVLLKASNRRRGITKEPTPQEWRAYTENLAKIKNLIWIGETKRINQLKNAFFIQPELKDVPANSVRIVGKAMDLETPDYDFMDEIEYHEAMEEETFPDFFFEEESESPRDLSKAIALNRKFSDQLGWAIHYDRINDLLLPFSGMENVSLGEEAFAEAVSKWQAKNRLTPDGIIGPNTWSIMKTQLKLAIHPEPIPITPPSSSNPPSVQNIAGFNQWYAKNIVQIMERGVVGEQFNSKMQLERLSQGQSVIRANPQARIIQILPIIYQICKQAENNNFREITIGSFLRNPNRDGACTGHCAGRSIDINFRNGSFETQGSVQMVVNILAYLLGLPSQFRKKIMLGLPIQGRFFGNKSLPKFRSAPVSEILDPQIRALIPQLGGVFPDNDNHLHIQVNWL